MIILENQQHAIKVQTTSIPLAADSNALLEVPMPASDAPMPALDVPVPALDAPVPALDAPAISVCQSDGVDPVVAFARTAAFSSFATSCLACSGPNPPDLVPDSPSPAASGLQPAPDAPSASAVEQPEQPEQPSGHAAHRLTAQQRQQIGLDALWGKVPIKELARRFSVSPKFVRAQRDLAKDALSTAFCDEHPRERVLFYLPVTDRLLRLVVLVLVLNCHSSLRGAQEALVLILGARRSLGWVHSVVKNAAQKAKEINAKEDLSCVYTAALDEIYQHTKPILVAVEVHSYYCCLLVNADHRDATTWGVHLLDMQQHKQFQPQTLIGDDAKGLQIGAKEAFPNAERRLDNFHNAYEVGKTERALESKAYKAIANVEVLKAEQAKAEKTLAQKELVQKELQQKELAQQSKLHKTQQQKEAKKAKKAKKEMEKLNKDLARTRKDLEKTKEDIEKTQKNLKKTKEDLPKAEQEMERKIEAADAVRTVGKWLREDVLSVSGGPPEEREMLYDWLVEEMRSREGVDEGVRKLVVRLANQKEGLMKFAWEQERDMSSLAGYAGVNKEVVRRLVEIEEKGGNKWQKEKKRREVEKKEGKVRYEKVAKHIKGLIEGVVRASSMVENVNGRLRCYFYLRREVGGDYLELLKFYLNHKKTQRSRKEERQGKTPASVLTGKEHPHWLQMLGYASTTQAAQTTPTALAA